MAGRFLLPLLRPGTLLRRFPSALPSVAGGKSEGRSAIAWSVLNSGVVRRIYSPRLTRRSPSSALLPLFLGEGSPTKID